MGPGYEKGSDEFGQGNTLEEFFLGREKLLKYHLENSGSNVPESHTLPSVNVPGPPPLYMLPMELTAAKADYVPQTTPLQFGSVPETANTSAVPATELKRGCHQTLPNKLYGYAKGGLRELEMKGWPLVLSMHFFGVLSILSALSAKIHFKVLESIASRRWADGGTRGRNDGIGWCRFRTDNVH